MVLLLLLVTNPNPPLELHHLHQYYNNYLELLVTICVLMFYWLPQLVRLENES